MMTLLDFRILIVASMLFNSFINCSERYRSLSLTVQKSKGPVFNFGNEMQKLLNSEIENILDLEVLYYEYLNVLRDFYIDDFSVRIRNFDNLNDLMDQKCLVLRECKSAMNAATPANENNSWNYEGYYNELEFDINQMLDDIGSINSVKSDERSISKTNNIITSKILKSFKWVLLQLLLFSFNYAQNEWQRLTAQRAADRRLAEVPEFPLL